MKKKNLVGGTPLDLGRGKTRKWIDTLIQQKQWGKNEGADEIIAVLDLLAHCDRHPFLNAFLTEKSPVWTLVREFTQSFFTPSAESNKLFQYLMKKQKGDELSIYAIGFSNATNALTAALLAHGVEGKEVITPSFNYASACNAIVSAGGIPKFVDIDRETFCLSTDSALRAVNKKTAAIIVTHINQAVDLLPLVKGLEKKKNPAAIFQDATAAIGSMHDGMGVGQLNPSPHGASVFSLGPTKVITGLGGALVMSHDYDFLRRMESISLHGVNPSNHEEVLNFGNNYKMNELSCVIALEQLKKRDAILEKRRALRKMYDEALKPLVKNGLLTLQKADEEGIVTFYMVRLKKSRHAVIEKMMREFQIGLSFWHCFHLEPLYRLRFGAADLPVTESLADKIVFLPFHTALEGEDVEYIVQSLNSVLIQS